MSDPFQEVEHHYRVSLDFLLALHDFNYPTVISTRGAMVAREPYLSLLREMKSVVVQVSMTSTLDEHRSQLEPFSPTASALLRAVERLTKSGVNVTCRWQPYVPGKAEDPATFVQRVADVGAKHLSLEHLKVPVDSNSRAWHRFEVESGVAWRERYRNGAAVREGREYILKGPEKLSTILGVAKLTRNAGMTFGAADNEYQYLSDTHCCCAGVDQFEGFENWFKHQIGYAVRKSNGRHITYESISNEWSPTGSIDRFLNSHTRLGKRHGLKGTLSDHVRYRWNQFGACGSPASFAGISPTEEFSPNGMRVYEWMNQSYDISDKITLA